MLFTMPERDAKLPLWNSDEVQANIAKYTERYQSKFDNVEDWISHEAGTMDDIMGAFTTITGVPVEVWDMFHERWRDIILIYLHLELPPDRLPEDTEEYTAEEKEFMAEELRRFFEDDESWLQTRPANN